MSSHWFGSGWPAPPQPPLPPPLPPGAPGFVSIHPNGHPPPPPPPAEQDPATPPPEGPQQNLPHLPRELWEMIVSNMINLAADELVERQPNGAVETMRGYAYEQDWRPWISRTCQERYREAMRNLRRWEQEMPMGYSESVFLWDFHREIYTANGQMDGDGPLPALVPGNPALGPMILEWNRPWFNTDLGLNIYMAARGWPGNYTVADFPRLIRESEEFSRRRYETQQRATGIRVLMDMYWLGPAAGWSVHDFD